MGIIFIFFASILTYCILIIVFGKRAMINEEIKARLEKTKVQVNNNNVPYENVPFIERIIKPSIDSFISFFSRILPVSEKEQAELSKQLLRAGMKIKPNDYIVMKLLVVFLFGLAFATYQLTFKINRSLQPVLLNSAYGMIAGYGLMQYMLKRRIRIRKEKMQMQLPGFLDLLSVCVEAGLGFDQAVLYVTGEYPCELSNEFKIVVRDTSLGSTRKEALTNLQDRCDIDQLKTFTAAVIQADEMGITLKNILTAQASNVRLAHKQKVEEQSQKLPVKILIPMLIFIFPVIFIILIVPAALRAMSAIGG